MAEGVGHPKGKIEQMAAPFITNGSVVVDVGANIGRFATWAAKIVGESGRVLAIEPDPRCHALGLDQLLATYPQVMVCSGAMGSGETADKATLYLSAATAESTLLRDALPDADRKRPTEVLVDLSYLDAFQMAGAALVKIDAQGMDHAVLQGARRLLQVCNAWIVECWPKGLTAAGSSPHALWQELANAGLTVCFADGLVITEDTLAQWLQTDQVFVNWLATR